MIELTLPWPPSTNSIWRSDRGRVHVSKDVRHYCGHVALLYAGKPEFKGRLAISITAHAPDNRRRDLDNLLKTPLDALKKAGAYEDDSQFDFISISRGAVLKNNAYLNIKINDFECMEK